MLQTLNFNLTHTGLFDLNIDKQVNSNPGPSSCAMRFHSIGFHKINTLFAKKKMVKFIPCDV